MRNSMQDLQTAVIKAAPPVAVSAGAAVLGLTLNEWVAIATLLYLALQAYFLVRDKWWRERGTRRAG